MKTFEPPASRREVLRGCDSLNAAGITGTKRWTMPGLVKIPTEQSPYYYRFKLGDAAATMVSDGPLPLGEPTQHFRGATPEEMRARLDANCLPTDNWVLEQNVLVMHLNGRTILFDNGMGVDTSSGPTTGQLMRTLAQAGINPASVDAVVMSHAHVDHCGGLVAKDGSLNFPNAQYYISQIDFDFWTDELNPVAASRDQARRNLLPVRDRIHFIKDEEEFLPGITALHTPGHSVGHMIFMINSGNDQLCFTGDLTHHAVLLLETPLNLCIYDTDAEQSARTRVRTLTMLAANRIPIMGYHFAWPGIGNVVKHGDGFRYFPKAMELMPVS